MMKKYFIGIFTITSFLCSCSDNEVSGLLPDGAVRVPMSFSVSQESQSRLYYIDNLYDLERISLAAQIADSLYFDYDFSQYWDVDDQEYRYAPVGATTSVDLYWPANDNTVVDFYAMNDPQNFHDRFHDYFTGEDKTLQNHSDTIWNIYRSHDLMAAFASTRRTTDGKVQLRFKHIMAELGILVQGEPHEEQSGVPTKYYMSGIEVYGEDKRLYHFDTNTWSDVDDADTFQYEYFSSNGYVFGFEADSIKTWVGDDPTDRYVFLIPGTYNIKVWYSSQHGWTSKEQEVTLRQGQKNRVHITLPYYEGDIVN